MIERNELRGGRVSYTVRLRNPNDPAKEIKRTFRDKKTAERYERAEKTARDQHTWIDQRDGNRPFPEVAAKWLGSNPAKRVNSYATDESAVRVHLVPALPGRIGSYSKADIQTLVDTWRLTAKPRTVRRRYGVLQAIFAFAVSSDWLVQSPCREIKLPAVTSTRRHKLTDEKVHAIAAAHDPRYRAMVWIGAILGLRWEEVAGMRVRAFDALGRTITIEEGGTIIRDKKGSPVVSDPKSAASHATLPIPVELVEILSAHLAARGLTAADGKRLIFEAPEGGPLRYSNWRNRIWVPAALKAGLVDMVPNEKGKLRYQGAGFHDLRRAYSTSLVADKVDVKTAQSMLRHSDARLTIGLYAEVEAENQRQATDQRGARLFGPRPFRGPEGRESRFQRPS
jgi:integrase